MWLYRRVLKVSWLANMKNFENCRKKRQRNIKLNIKKSKETSILRHVMRNRIDIVYHRIILKQNPRNNGPRQQEAIMVGKLQNMI